MYEDLKYKIVHNEGASAVFLPIPLSKIKSAEIVSSVEFKSSAEFVEFPGCCSFINEVQINQNTVLCTCIITICSTLCKLSAFRENQQRR